MNGFNYVLVGVALTLLVVPSPAAPAPKVKGYATPEAYFKAIREAAEKDDWKAITTSLTPESQMAATGAAVLAAAFLDSALRPDSAHRKDLSVILARHGVSREMLAAARRLTNINPHTLANPPRANAKRWGAQIKDKPGFAGAVLKIASVYWVSSALSRGELKDLKVAKGRATAAIVYPTSITESKPKTPVIFVKDKDGWKMGFVEAEKGQ